LYTLKPVAVLPREVTNDQFCSTLVVSFFSARGHKVDIDISVQRPTTQVELCSFRHQFLTRIAITSVRSLSGSQCQCCYGVWTQRHRLGSRRTFSRPCEQW